MLMRTDPFREFDRFAQQVMGSTQGTWSRPTAMPMDAYRRGEEFVVEFDLPGVDPAAIELSVERNVLTVRAERRPVPRDETLDTDRVAAAYEAGVLTLTIPVAERAKPRSISISHTDTGRTRINA